MTRIDAMHLPHSLRELGAQLLDNIAELLVLAMATLKGMVSGCIEQRMKAVRAVQANKVIGSIERGRAQSLPDAYTPMMSIQCTMCMHSVHPVHAFSTPCACIQYTMCMHSVRSWHRVLRVMQVRASVVPLRSTLVKVRQLLIEFLDQLDPGPSTSP